MKKKNKDLRRICLLYGNTSDMLYNPNYNSLNSTKSGGEYNYCRKFYIDLITPYLLKNPTKFFDFYELSKICIENRNNFIVNDDGYQGYEFEYDEWNTNKDIVPKNNFTYFYGEYIDKTNSNFKGGLCWAYDHSANYIMFPRQQTFTDDTFVTSSFLWNIMNPNKVEPKMDAEFPYVKDDYVQITDPDAVFYFNRLYTDDYKVSYEKLKITGFTKQFKYFGDNLKHIHNLLYWNNKCLIGGLLEDSQYRKKSAGFRIFTDGGTCTFGIINNCITDQLGWSSLAYTTKAPPFTAGNFNESATNSGSYAFFQPDSTHTLEWYNNIYKTYGYYDTNLLNQSIVNKVNEILIGFTNNYFHYFMYHDPNNWNTNYWLECCGTHYKEDYRVYWYK